MPNQGRIKINKEDEKKLYDTIEQLKDFPDTIHKELIGMASRSVKEIKASPRTPVLTGYMKDHVHYEGHKRGVDIVSPAPYSGYVERGTSRQRAQPFFSTVLNKQIRATTARLLNILKKLSTR